jgi:hypothetical protein
MTLVSVKAPSIPSASPAMTILSAFRSTCESTSTGIPSAIGRPADCFERLQYQ